MLVLNYVIAVAFLYENTKDRTMETIEVFVVMFPFLCLFIFVGAWIYNFYKFISKLIKKILKKIGV
jgi:Na+/melibiose symporter-like transporter